MATIRKAISNDIPAIDTCNRKIFPENYDYLFYKKLFNLNSSSVYVLEDNRNIVGYIIGVINEHLFGGYPFIEDYFFADFDSDEEQNNDRENFVKFKGHIISLALLPDYRRKGYATQLLNLVENDFKLIPNIKSIMLNVRPSNTANNLYKKLNYIIKDTLPSYYENGEDGLLLEKNLN